MEGRHYGLFWTTFCLQNLHFGGPGGHFGTLGLYFGGPGLPRGPQRGPSGVKGGFLMDFGCPWGPLGGSVWAHFRYISMIFSIKSGGWVTDPVFRWFRGGKVTSAQWLYVVKT